MASRSSSGATSRSSRRSDPGCASITRASLARNGNLKQAGTITESTADQRAKIAGRWTGTTRIWTFDSRARPSSPIAGQPAGDGVPCRSPVRRTAAELLEGLLPLIGPGRVRRGHGPERHGAVDAAGACPEIDKIVHVERRRGGAEAMGTDAHLQVVVDRIRQRQRLPGPRPAGPRPAGSRRGRRPSPRAASGTRRGPSARPGTRFTP